MTITQGHTSPAGAHGQQPPTPPPAAEAPPRAAAITLAALRIGVGFVFLWAFLDKTFGLGYATGTAKAWVQGGSPTKGFLGSVDVGPLQSMFHTWAGTWWADWLFMLAMLGIGLAVVIGIALRPAAVAGTIVLALMWFAEFPLAQHAADGTASGSTNPFVDYHVVYILALITLAATQAGRFWGLGGWWSGLPFVRDHRWAV
ncbi:DoxX family membrane protein [Pseudonocardia sp. N23]|uniref:DoxX family membrane protein n=1 Tax=Pseudonocardia sp. N23 TaxID=1987376 RepID=UPI000C0361A7|nr:DoxX family membrane protein [Pseudonocardia sp. N23]GAY07334.1 putative integral membrane protein SCJ12.13c [Pseudonocardia sp. N23]